MTSGNAGHLCVRASPFWPVPVISDDGLRRLLKVCEGKSFEARRDTALMMLLLDTGARRAELVGLKLTDIDQDLDVLLVLGKGRRERALPYGHKGGARPRPVSAGARPAQGRPSAVAVDWAPRAAHPPRLGPHAQAPWSAGWPPRSPPHQFRHTFAHQWLAEGGGETDLMRLGRVCNGGPRQGEPTRLRR
jgi:integrase